MTSFLFSSNMKSYCPLKFFSSTWKCALATIWKFRQAYLMSAPMMLHTKIHVANVKTYDGRGYSLQCAIRGQPYNSDRNKIFWKHKGKWGPGLARSKLDMACSDKFRGDAWIVSLCEIYVNVLFNLHCVRLFVSGSNLFSWYFILLLIQMWSIDPRCFFRIIRTLILNACDRNLYSRRNANKDALISLAKWHDARVRTGWSEPKL